MSQFTELNLGGMLKVGDQYYNDGSVINFRGEKQGALVNQNAHGRYTEPAMRRTIYFNQANAVAMSAPSTTALGNIVWNPPNSGKLLSLNKWSIMCQVTDANADLFQLGYSAQLTLPATTTASTFGCTYLGVSGVTPGVARGYAATTLEVAVTPIFNMGNITAAIATTGEDIIQGSFDGGIIVPPGTVIHICCVAAAAAAGVTSTIWWEEIPE